MRYVNDRIQKILETEFSLFDKVNGLEGRASCQDDRETFFLQRGSQLSMWSEEMRASYYNDLLDAEASGRNPLSEKYGYMMERTSPEEYLLIRDRLPAVSKRKLSLIGDICRIQVKWQEELAEHYPALAGRGRSIHSSEDEKYNTSFETYLFGELKTYSETTLEHYLSYIGSLEKQGKNLNEMILEKTTDAYGYSSLADAEKKAALTMP